jgi:hypothetical protein
MPRRRRVVAIVVTIAAVATGVLIQRTIAGASTTELVANGGFEKPAIANPSWQNFSSIPGWTENAPGHCGIEIQNHVAGSPFEGDQFTELDSNCSTGIHQDLDTERGDSYRLSLRFSARPGTGPADNILEVWWNGKLIDTEQADGTGHRDTVWKKLSYTVRATKTTTRLAFSDAGVSNSLGTYIDAVSVTARSDDRDGEEEDGGDG